MGKSPKKDPLVQALESIPAACADVVDKVWPLLDEARLKNAMAINDKTDQMLAVSQLVVEMIPVPEMPLAATLFESGIRLAVLERLK